MEALIGVVVGAGLVLAAPHLFSGIKEAVRPLAKEVVKGGLVVCGAVNDLVAEAKAELAEGPEKGTDDAGKEG